MTAAEFGTYLVFAAAFSLVLAIANAIRGKFYLAGACLAVAGGAIAYRSASGDLAVVVAGVAGAAFLVGDIVTRLRRDPKGAPKP